MDYYIIVPIYNITTISLKDPYVKEALLKRILLTIYKKKGNKTILGFLGLLLIIYLAKLDKDIKALPKIPSTKDIYYIRIPIYNFYKIDINSPYIKEAFLNNLLFKIRKIKGKNTLIN